MVTMNDDMLSLELFKLFDLVVPVTHRHQNRAFYICGVPFGLFAAIDEHNVIGVKQLLHFGRKDIDWYFGHFFAF